MAAILPAAWPSPYGFCMPARDSRKPGDAAVAQQARMDSAVASAWRTLRPCSRRRWRMPDVYRGNGERRRFHDSAAGVADQQVGASQQAPVGDGVQIDEQPAVAAPREKP